MHLTKKGSAIGSTVEISEIESLSDGHIIIGDGAGAPTTRAAFASSTGALVTYLAPAGGTVVVSTPIFNGTQTWNDAGVAFTGIKLNVTSTASAAASLLMDLQVGGASQFSVTKGGIVTGAIAIVPSGLYFDAGFQNGMTTDGGTSGTAIRNGGSTLFNLLASGLTLAAPIGLGTNYFSADVFLSRKAAAVLHHGAADAASPVAQTLGVQGARGGTDTDVAGADLTIRSGIGTGSATASKIVFQTPAVGASGTTAQTSTTRVEIRSDGLYVSSSGTLMNTLAALSDGAAAQVGTLTNAPTAGNPTKWISINDNGTTRYIPTWT